MKVMPVSKLIDLENDPNWVVGKKYNGFSELMVIKDGRIRIFNRSGTEQTDNVPHLTKIDVPQQMDLVLAGEGISQDDKLAGAKSIFGSYPEHAIAWQQLHGKATFAAVNITRFHGEDLTHIPFGERLALFECAVDNLNQLGMFYLIKETLYPFGKRAVFDNVVAQGGEGIVAKKLTGFESDWFKVKRLHTWDVVIIGFTQGKGKYSNVIGAIIYGCYDTDGNMHEIGKCSGMTDADRTMFTGNPDNFIGKVIEVKGQEIGNNGGIIFPRFVRIRNDKLPTECLTPGLPEERS